MHEDGFVFCRITDDYAQFTAFAAIDVDLRHHLAGIQIQAVRLGTIHDAEATACLCRTFLVDDLRDVIHSSWFLFLRGNGRIADLQLNLVLFGPLTGDLVGTLHGRQIFG